MHIGVFLKGHPPHSGGGYTFESDVLKALVVNARESRHTFTIVGDAEWAGAALHASTSAAVAFHPLRGFGFSWRTRSLLEEAFPLLRIMRLIPGKLDRAAARAGIELMWFLPGGGYEVLDIPYIATVWDLMHRTHPWFPELSSEGGWDIRETRLRRFLQRSTCVIVGTETGRDEVCRYYQIAPERVRLLRHPTPGFVQQPVSRDDAEMLARFKLHGEYLLYPAQFWAHKNHAALLHALKSLRDQRIELALALVGADHGNLDHVRSLTRSLGLESQVKLLGFVSQQELVALYRCARALVYPSFCGPENLPPLEAFALGCPVVAADIPGSREQLGDAALLFDPMDVAQLTKAIATLHCDESLRQKLIGRGRERARQWQSVDYVRGIFRILDEFANIRNAWRENDPRP